MEVRAVPVRVTGDPHHLQRILRNVVDNAARHARAPVAISVAETAATATITATDDGPGIPAADFERVFDRVVRLDDYRSRQRGGAGLGLAIARELAAAHGGGTVTVGEAPDVGAEVHVTLPKTRCRSRRSLNEVRPFRVYDGSTETHKWAIARRKPRPGQGGWQR